MQGGVSDSKEYVLTEHVVRTTFSRKDMYCDGTALRIGGKKWYPLYHVWLTGRHETNVASLRHEITN